MHDKIKALLEINPGAGNLRLDVFFASMIGPNRVAHGAKKNFSMASGVGQRIAVTTGASGSNAVSFVRVYLAARQNGPVPVVFGKSETQGTADIPVNLVGSFPAGQEVSRFFDAVLLPGEELYATTQGDASLLVSQVWF